MSNTWGANLQFDENFYKAFGERHGIKTQFVPSGGLGVYRRVLHDRLAEPEVLGIDVVWPASLADDLVDLRPYLKAGEQKALVARLLADYTVHGRLVAIPVYVDMGVLYYRPGLLEKYGFPKAPETWDELEKMAIRIQNGERRAGNRNFWGYVWQGPASEAGTCNALEWEASAGGGAIIDQTGRIDVSNAPFAGMLRRAVGWLGTISPPAEYVYHEDDSVNMWDAGNAAFMRNWASGYAHISAQPGNDRRHFAVAPLPAGPGGHKGTIGGMGLAVSKYAANRELAIQSVLELANESNGMKRLLATGGLPVHEDLLRRAEVKSRTQMLAISADLLASVVSRPALISGDKYEAVSHEYATAVNRVLRRQETPEAAMAALATKLAAITGPPASAK
jgi:trehalose/maltose transport system substrate-binding protein